MVKVFRELTVFGEPGSLETLISRLDNQLNEGWSRDREREQGVRNLSAEQCFFFLCCSNAERPAVVLGMLLEGRRLKIASVVLQEQRKITKDQYNATLIEFYLRFLQPAALEADLPVELSSDECEERTIDDAFRPEVFGCFESFIFCAEGLWSRPSWSHPHDQGRLFAFLIEANRGSNKIEIGLLRHWLVNDRQWPPNKVDQLLGEIEFGTDLLAYGDEHCSRRTDRQVRLASTYALPANPSSVGRERTPEESKSLSRCARMLRSAQRLVLTTLNAIATVVGHTRRHRSGRQDPASGLLRERRKKDGGDQSH